MKSSAVTSHPEKKKKTLIIHLLGISPLFQQYPYNTISSSIAKLSCCGAVDATENVEFPAS